MFKVNIVLFTFDALAGGIIALWKSVVITVKVEIGGAAAQIEITVKVEIGGGAAQIELREVAHKRRLYNRSIPCSRLGNGKAVKHKGSKTLKQ